ncbi:MAG: rRNA pseudouridine synthase [Aquificae bacterium]|nr:rRNA pseudouridine synthase [Aquificota bacterium]
MEKIRLDKFLSDLGFGSRKETKKLVKQKRVKVNDAVVNNPSFHLNPEKDAVSVDEQPVQYKKHHYYMLNKPSGYITATEDRDYPTVMEIFADLPFYRKLFPIGRLDMDTEGLLIITDDGQFAHRISHPKWEVEKEYFAVVEGDASGLEKERERFEREGLQLKDYRTKPFKLQLVETSPDRSKIKITVSEGKHHIVKRIMERLGYPVLYLKRVRIGSLQLDEGLETGQYRELTEEEVEKLKKQVNL